MRSRSKKTCRYMSHLGALFFIGCLVTFIGEVQSSGGSIPQSKTPDTPAGARLAWALEVVQPDAHVEPVGVFTPEFLALISRETIIESIKETSLETGGFELLDVLASSELRLKAAVRARSSSACWSIEIHVEEEQPHGITRIVYQFEPELGIRYGDGWPQLLELLGQLDGTVTFAAYAVDAEQLNPISTLNEEEILAIGSTFKLWVLGALGNRIARGESKWNDPITILDERKSLPSGTMQELAEGEQRSLTHYATQMISISDNTATDHLIGYLGRDYVEEYALAHGSPGERNIPLLTTREFFKLKLIADDNLRGRYIAATPSERAAIINDSIAPLPLPSDTPENEVPIAIDQIEYFASAVAVAELMLELKEMGERPGLEPIEEALTKNPGIEWDKSTWPKVAYKGGSEAGVLYAIWYMERNDGQSFVMCCGINDSTAPVDTNRVVRILKAAGALLAKAG